jgi:hypothetical protein
LTVNGNPLKSGETYNASLNPGMNPIDIAVTGADGTVRTYTVNVSKNTH